jgi:hypothetical protein
MAGHGKGSPGQGEGRKLTPFYTKGVEKWEREMASFS